MRNGNTARILVADDDASVLAAVAKLLRRAGYEVLQASDGERATEMLSEHPVDLAIVDIFMPKVDGMKLTTRGRVAARRPQTVRSARGSSASTSNHSFTSMTGRVTLAWSGKRGHDPPESILEAHLCTTRGPGLGALAREASGGNSPARTWGCVATETVTRRGTVTRTVTTLVNVHERSRT